MLNTKPIKKQLLDNKIPDLSSDTKNTENTNKVIQLASTKQEELENIVKQANEDNIHNITNENGIDKQIEDPILNREFTYDRYKDKNLNISNVIDGNKMFTRDIHEINKTNQIQHQININNNQTAGAETGTNIYGELVKIEWNDIDNCFIINNINSNEIECKIFNDNILRYIVSNDINDNGIKRYLFIISWNNQLENFEFNFIDSIFTNNFDMMIKLQNFIYDTLINFNELDVSDSYNYQESILMFYFQMIIYLFNNFDKYSINNDSTKISRIYSSIVYRFSSLILKNIIKIKNSLDNNNIILNDLMLLRSDIFSQINFMNDKLEQYNQINKNKTKKYDSESDINISITNTSDSYKSDDSTKSTNSTKSNTNNSNNSTKSSTNNSNNSDNSDNSDNSYRYVIENKRELNKTTDSNSNQNDTYFSVNNNIENLGYIDKNGKKIKKIKDLFTDELQINTDNSDNSEDYDSDKNGYFEVDDAFADYNDTNFAKNDKHNINNLVNLIEPNNVDKVIPIDNSIISNIKSYTTASKERSYNPNSAIKNSKIFEIPI